jgi:drug/metabolite transporter (DMT)-like permease
VNLCEGLAGFFVILSCLRRSAVSKLAVEIQADRFKTLHRLGVGCGLTAGAWLGAAEAPTKLVLSGLSPFVISLGMVAGVFVARWTIPTALVGTRKITEDLREKPHLIVWAIMAGMLWAVANTLTVFAIRDVGLSIAFPLWNTNSLIGLFWGWLFFNELKSAGRRAQTHVLGGSLAIVAGACLLAAATTHDTSLNHHQALNGIAAALGAGILWGTMYIPYRKAYLSGMNPLSFVTVFTVGELGAMITLALTFHGGLGPLTQQLQLAKPALFWLFLGGFCWVLGDLFQQYAAKYIGIGRGIPLSNTNQLWGLAWGLLVFGELAGQSVTTKLLVVGGSAVMILGAIAIGRAEAPESERESWRRILEKESDRYGLDLNHLEAHLSGDVPRTPRGKWQWWEFLIMAIAASIFIWLGFAAAIPAIRINFLWMLLLSVLSAVVLVLCARKLHALTRFN